MTREEKITVRLNQGLSLRAAAAKIGVSRRLLHEFENGVLVAMPHPHNAKKLADFYGLSVTAVWPVEERAA